MPVAMVKTPEPERAALARAIEAKVAAEAALADAHSKLVDFETKFAATESKFYAARSDFDKAKEYIADLLRSNAGDEEALGRHAAEFGEVHPRERLRQAEIALTECRERYELAKEGATVVNASHANATALHQQVVRKCSAAADTVEMLAYHRLLAEDRRLFVDLFKRRQVLTRLARHFEDIQAREPRHPIAVELRDYLDKNDRLPSIFGGNAIKTEEHRSLAQEAEAPWNAAHEALMRDADACLPGAQ